MPRLIELIINFVEKFYHQKRIFSVLRKLNLMTAIDVGAHKGEFLSALCKLETIKKIYAIEPQKEIFKELEKFTNDERINLFNFGISESNDKKVLNINSLTSTSTMSEIDTESSWFKLKNKILNNKSSFTGKIEIETIKLDDFCNNNNINAIDFLKIDTEGHELKVLQGASELVKNKKIKSILLEFHFSKMYKNYSTEEIGNFLAENNFTLVKKFKFPFLSFEDRLYMCD